ncbi:MAG: septum formation inhibitor Maf [Lachnospiraceae bacterium]|nr:septum formation inhibitor Maf [Lachnospiraceae bacterium]
MNLCKKKIILASASPRRKELLTQAGIPFTIRVSGAEENASCDNPCDLVKELSGMKAENIFAQLTVEEAKEALVIGADTVVALDGEIMGKPGSPKRAVEMLTALQGKTHQVYTGVTFVYQNQENGVVTAHSFYEKTDVTFYPMTEQEIADYVATGEPMDKAGAYAIQGKCAAYIKGINGDYSNVVGLPIGRVYQELKHCF